MREIILNSCASICAVLTLISYIPQLIKTLRTKHADDLFVGSWTLWFIGAITWEVYAVVDGTIGLIVSQTLELIMILITLVLTFIYGKSRKV